MAKAKDLLQQIAQGAQKEQVTLLIRDTAVKLYLMVDVKVNISGRFAYVSIPAVEGFYEEGRNNLLNKATLGSEAEAAFFPERAEELRKKEEELSQLKRLARKHGFSLSAIEGAAPIRTRAPRGSKPKVEKKEAPKKGDKFTSNQNGITYTITEVDGKALKMKGEDGSTKEVTYSGIFWRWHSRA